MIASMFASYPLSPVFFDDLTAAVTRCYVLWCPEVAANGVCRLQPAKTLPLSVDATPQPVIPTKKLLLPPREQLWDYGNGSFTSASDPQPIAIAGIAPCDLQAIWYLDQVFAEDPLYCARRVRTLLIGQSCEPSPECRCDSQLMPLAGDLFFSGDRIWALSQKGAFLLHQSGCCLPEDLPLPWPDDLMNKRQDVTAEQLSSAQVWGEESRRCLSCGACSAVCPTCYCFDTLDAIELNGIIKRSRVWDNCFFAEHGTVAGGHDFRSGRAARLRFRMEHKYLGFGDLSGQNSCVGCGRCRKVCPVDIDLNSIAKRLVSGAAP